MNIALIFAGGVGKRMHGGATPKQFLEIYGRPIIIYTLDVFQSSEDIDAICISCVESHISYMRKLCDKYGVTKVKWIVPGGETGQLSIYNGLCAVYNDCPEDSAVLIHDGVRPIIDTDLLKANVESVRKYGSAISCARAIETHAVTDEDGFIVDVASRTNSVIAKAPQSFVLKDIMEAHKKSMAIGKTDFIDSASMMKHYGHSLHTVECGWDNIKVTTPNDYFLVKSLIDARQSSKAFGL